MSNTVAPDEKRDSAELRNALLLLQVEELQNKLTLAEAEREQLKALLNTPEVDDFDKALPLGAGHQVCRWGSEHDAGKAPADWFWLVGNLAGKALAAHISGDTFKAKHHCISTAAVLRNWHAHIRSGDTTEIAVMPAEKAEGIGT
jgi:hypothetical protein